MGVVFYVAVLTLKSTSLDEERRKEGSEPKSIVSNCRQWLGASFNTLILVQTHWTIIELIAPLDWGVDVQWFAQPSFQSSISVFICGNSCTTSNFSSPSWPRIFHLSSSSCECWYHYTYKHPHFMVDHWHCECECLKLNW